MTLGPGPFADSLCKKLALNLEELRYKVAKFMQLDELREFYNQARSDNNSDTVKEKEKGSSQHFPNQR